MRAVWNGLGLIGLAVSLSGCGGSGSNSGQDTSNTTHIEAMGPEGGSNVTTTPDANAANAPVGATENGNVAPGDANPSNPRPGAATGAGNSQ